MNSLSHSSTNSNLYTVYALIDPRTSEIRYIGITVNAYKRFQDHLACRGTNLVKNNWMQDLKEAGVLPIMETIETVETQAFARQRELYWIEHYRASGLALLNFHKGHGSTVGRHRNEQETHDVLTYRLTHKKWPVGLSSYMRWYYNRNYIQRTGKNHELVVHLRATLRK